MRYLLSAASLALALVVAGTASAHHSFAMFDPVKEKVIAGTVMEFQWTNPHIWVYIMAPDAKGRPVKWGIEGGSVAGLSRQGWRRNTLKPGDKIKMVLHPLRSGEPGGSLMGVVTAEGKALGEPLYAPGQTRKLDGPLS